MSPTPEPTKPPPTDGSTDGDGSSFITGKPEAKPAEGEAKPEAKAETKPDAAVVPEKYEDFKLPDGYKLDEEASKEINGLFKELGLSQDAAQKLVDYYAKNSLSAAEAPYKAWADLQKTWMADISDRFGSRAEAVRTDIGKAINTLPPSLARSFKAALDLTGAGSHPDVVEALSILLKDRVEGGSVRQGGPSAESQKAPGAPSRPSAAEAIYGHLIPNRNQ